MLIPSWSSSSWSSPLISFKIPHQFVTLQASALAKGLGAQGVVFASQRTRDFCALLHSGELCIPWQHTIRRTEVLSSAFTDRSARCVAASVIQNQSENSCYLCHLPLTLEQWHQTQHTTQTEHPSGGGCWIGRMVPKLGRDTECMGLGKAALGRRPSLSWGRSGNNLATWNDPWKSKTTVRNQATKSAHAHWSHLEVVVLWSLLHPLFRSSEDRRCWTSSE